MFIRRRKTRREPVDDLHCTTRWYPWMAQITGVSDESPEALRGEMPESAERILGGSGIRGLSGPLHRATQDRIFLFTAGALSFYDAAVFDN